MLRKKSMGVLITILALLLLCLFSCQSSTVSNLEAKYDNVYLGINKSLIIDNYITFEGKGKFSYAIENSSVLQLKDNKVTAIAVGEGYIIVSSNSQEVRFKVIVIEDTVLHITAQYNYTEYDGEIKNISILQTLPQDAVVQYFCDGQEFFGSAEIGVYEIEVVVTATNWNINYIQKQATLTITKGTYNMTNVFFVSKEYDFDGSAKRVEITGQLPSGVTVSYQSNVAINSGTYLAKAIFSYDSEHYEHIEEMTARLTIKRKIFDIGQNGFVNTVVTYNGTKQNVEIKNLPQGLSVDYLYKKSGEEYQQIPTAGLVDSGNYTIKANFSVVQGSLFDLNYDLKGNKEISFTIQKAYFTTQDLRWDTLPNYEKTDSNAVDFVYNGQSLIIGYNVNLVGETPKGVNGEFSDSNNSVIIGFIYKTIDGDIDATSYEFVDAKRYTIYARFTMPSGSERNYHAISDMEFSFTIYKADFDTSGVSFSTLDQNSVDYAVGENVTFDNEDHQFVITATAEFLDKVEVEYYHKYNNGDFNPGNGQIKDAGQYIIEARFVIKQGANNYNAILKRSIAVAIVRQQIPLDGVVYANKTVEYDGSEHSVVAENIPNGLSVIYNNNAKTNAGSYNVEAIFSYESVSKLNYYFSFNNIEVESLTAQLKINKKQLTQQEFEAEGFYAVGATYEYTKTLSNYTIYDRNNVDANNRIQWQNTSLVPTVATCQYYVVYNIDSNNYLPYETTISLEITPAVIDGNNIKLYSQFLSHSGSIRQPTLTIENNAVVNLNALNLTFDIDAEELKDLGKYNLTNIDITLVDTVNYSMINIPTLSDIYVVIYNSNIFTYNGLQLTKYKGSASTVEILDGTQSIFANAFSGNSAINQIIVPSSINSLASSAFYNIPNLQSITLPYLGTTRASTNTNKSLAAVFGVAKNENLAANLTHVYITDENIVYADAFSGAKFLHTIVYQNSIVEIKEYAFLHCQNLEYLFLGDNNLDLTSMGEGIFKGCYNLIDITLPFIGSNIQNIKTISYLIGNNAGDNLYTQYNWQSLQLTSPNLTSLPSEFLKGMYCLSTIRLPSTLSQIGDSSFYGVKATVALNDNFTAITFGMFKGYLGASVVIPQTVTAIGKESFKECINLTTLNIPKNVVSIGSNAFSGVLAVINFDENAVITDIGDYAFAYYGGNSVNLPSTVTTLGKNVFEYSKIGSMGLSSNITTIGNNVFANCTELHTVTTSMTFIGNFMFVNCGKLSTIIMDNVTNIYQGAFQNCTRLFSIVINQNVTNIGIDAFSGCANLTTLYIDKQTPPTITGNSFSKDIAIKVYIIQSANLADYENYYKTTLGYNNMTFYRQL